MAETVIRQEFDRAGVPHRVSVQGPRMLVPTLLECGSEEQRREYIAPTLTGELTWCQGYSEPGAGSDLASLQSRAELVGDEWVINGQKIWTSNAARGRHDVRPVPHRARRAEARGHLLPADPDEDAGHRGAAADADAGRRRLLRGVLRRRAHSGEEHRRPARRGLEGLARDAQARAQADRRSRRAPASSFDALVALAREVQRDGRPALEDPVVRQRLAEIAGYVATQEWAVARMLTAIHQQPGRGGGQRDADDEAPRHEPRSR